MAYMMYYVLSMIKTSDAVAEWPCFEVRCCGEECKNYREHAHVNTANSPGKELPIRCDVNSREGMHYECGMNKL